MVSIKVLMIITGFVMMSDGLEQVWEIRKEGVTAEHCMTMSEIVAGAGKAGALIVKCEIINKLKITEQ